LNLPSQTLAGITPDLLRSYQEAIEIMGLNGRPG
jgi:hypothetical protein